MPRSRWERCREAGESSIRWDRKSRNFSRRAASPPRRQARSRCSPRRISGSPSAPHIPSPERSSASDRSDGSPPCDGGLPDGSSGRGSSRSLRQLRSRRLCIGFCQRLWPHRQFAAFNFRSAFLTARGAPPPPALARRLPASLGPPAPLTPRGGPPPPPPPVGPHPHALSLGDSAPRSGRRRYSLRVGPHPHALSLGDSAPRSGRRRYSLRVAPPPRALARRLRASLGPQALLTARGPTPTRSRSRLRASLGPQELPPAANL